MNRPLPWLRPKALIGMVHLQALPGSPRSRLSIGEIACKAAGEARLLAEAGFDAVMIENMHDAPYVHGRQGPEIVAAMTAAGLAVRAELARVGLGHVPMGVQVLSGGTREAVAVALACGGVFARIENFVFAHVADEGLLAEAEAGPLLRYRRSIGAEGISLLCDIKKKHASHAITADVSLGEAAAAAEFFGADAVVVTGSATGRATSAEDLAAARAGTSLPVIVGSGATPETVAALLETADAIIVGSAIKHGGVWHADPDPARVEAMVRAVHAARGEA